MTKIRQTKWNEKNVS